MKKQVSILFITTFTLSQHTSGLYELIKNWKNIKTENYLAKKMWLCPMWSKDVMYAAKKKASIFLIFTVNKSSTIHADWGSIVEQKQKHNENKHP